MVYEPDRSPDPAATYDPADEVTTPDETPGPTPQADDPDALRALAAINVAGTTPPGQTPPLVQPQFQAPPDAQPGMPGPAQEGARGALQAIQPDQAPGPGGPAPGPAQAPPGRAVPPGQIAPTPPGGGVAPIQGPPGSAVLQNPYGKGPTDPVAQAQSDEQAAAYSAGTAQADALKAENAAKAAHVTDLARVDQDYARNLGQVDAAYQASKQAVHRINAAENAAWMQKMQEDINREPTPGRWWENQSGFSKVMWALSLAFGAKAQSFGATQNAGLSMIQKEIESDVQSQKDRMARQVKLDEAQGKLLDSSHAERLSDLQDDHGMRVARLGVVTKALEAQTTAPGALDDAAANAQGKAAVGQMMAKIAADRVKTTEEAKQKDLDRRHQEAVAAMGENAAMQRLQYTQQHEDRRKALEEATKMASRAEAISAKYAAPRVMPSEEEKDRISIPIQGGVALRDASGNRSVVKVAKGQAEKFTEDAQNFQAKAVGLAALRDAMKESGFADKVFNNDNERRMALSQLAEPMVKQMLGRFNKDTVQQVKEYILGESPDSLVERFKGASNEDQMKLLDKEIGAIPGAAKAKLSKYSTNLADDPNLELDIGGLTTDTRPPPKPTQDIEDRQSAAGVQVKQSEAPKDAAEYRTRKAEGSLPDLSKGHPELAKAVEDTLSAFHGASPDLIAKDRTAAEDKIRQYKRDHAGFPGDVKAADDAYTRIYAEGEDAQASAEKALTSLKTDLARSFPGYHPVIGDIKEEALKKHGLQLTTPEAVDLARNIDKYREALNRQGGRFTGDQLKE